MTTKTPQKWNPQPIGYGSVKSVGANNLVDQSSNQLVDQAGNALVTGTTQVSPKNATKWTDTGA